MKHIKLFFSVASLAIATLVSCQKEIESGEKSSNENVVILKGFVDDNINNLTKTSLVDGVDIQWASTDAISAFDYDFELQHSISVELSNSGKTANFTMPAAEAYFYAIYPKDENASINTDSEVITTTLPTSQKAVANSFGPGANIALADASNGTEGMQFYNGGALVSVKVNNDNITKIVLSGSGEYAYMSGPCTMNFYGTGAEKTVVCQSTYEEQINEVVMRGDFVNGSTYYFVVLPGIYETPRLKITNDLGQTVTLKNSSTIEVNSNDNYFIADLPDLTESFAKKPCVATFDFSDPAEYGYIAPESNSGVDLGTDPISVGKIGFSVDNGEASNNTRFYNSAGTIDLRGYNKSSFTVSAAPGFVITSMNLAGGKVGSAYITPDSGTYTNGENNRAGSWTGEANSVTFSLTNTMQLTTLEVVYEREDPNKPYLVLDKSSDAVAWDAEESSFAVTSRNISDLVISQDEEDAVLIKSMEESKDGDVTTVNIHLNKSTNDQTANEFRIKVSSAAHPELNKVYTITQAVAPAKGLTVNPTSLSLANTVGSKATFNVQSNYEFTATPSDNSKVSVSTSGSVVTVTALVANDTEEDVSLGSITVRNTAGSEIIVSVKQTGVVPTAADGTTLWSEDWTGYEADAKPSSATGYGDAVISYTYSNNNTKIYADKLAGSNSPELLLNSGNSTMTATNVPTGGSTSMSFSLKSNKTTITLAIDGATVTKGTGLSWTITVPSGTTNMTMVIKNTGSSNARIDDLELVVGAEKAEQSDMAFGEPAKTITLGTDYEIGKTYAIQSVSGVKDNAMVTYAGDDSEVATVNSTTGAITILKAGKLTVTATAAATSSYKAKSVSYELTIKDNSDNGGEYTIVFKTGSGDGTTLSTSTNLSNVISEGEDYVASIKTATKCYYASSNGIKIGASSGSSAFEITLADEIKAKVKSIQIVTAKYGSDTGTLTLSNGSTSLKSGIKPEDGYTHEFTTATAVTSIKLVPSTKRAYLKKIIIVTE